MCTTTDRGPVPDVNAMEEPARWSDERLHDFVAGQIVVALDEFGQRVAVAPWIAEIATVPDPADATWPPSLDVCDPADRLIAVRAFLDSLERPNEVVENVARWQEGGRWRALRSRRVNLIDDERVGAMLRTLVDEGPVEIAPAGEGQFDVVQYEAPVWVVQHCDKLGTIVECEGMSVELLGRTAEELIGTGALDQFETATHADIIVLWLELVKLPGGVRTMQLPLLRTGDEPRWAEVTLINRLGAEDEGNVLVILHDISDKRARESTQRAELHHKAAHDALTGVLNRAALDDRLEAAVHDEPGDLVVLFLDLDSFKTVNDTYGHDAGDLVLKAVADRLRATVRPSDHIGRYGGDEFVAICHGVAPSAELLLTGRLAAVLDTPVEWEGGSWIPRASIGVARHRPGEDAAALLRRADADMFCRKRASPT